MSKNVKRIVALALAVGTISAAAPATSANLLMAKAYAADNSDSTFDSLKLQTSSGGSIKIYDSSSYDDKVDSDGLEPDTDYFAKTSSDTITIKVDGVKSKYVRVFKNDSDSTKGKKITSDISLSSGTTKLIIRIYSEDPGSDVRYEDENDKLNDYTIKIKCTADSSDTSDNSDDSDSYDDIYLDRLSINGDSVSLSDSKTTYDYNVNSNTEEATIKAVPPDEDEDTVTIDDDEVDSSDKFKKTVDLKQGKNQFKVELEDSDSNKRIYTININRGSSSDDSTTTTSTTKADSKPNTATDATTTKVNQWVQVGGNRQYLDGNGKILKNSWVQSYYVNDYGNMVTDWYQINGAWYYFGTDGARKTGWQMVRGNWYYLDGQGKMFTGWMKHTDGKYYYLNPGDGSMAHSTKIQGYTLGADGAWTGR
ncbi:N-acetylmuramoyl-L-alanine amidase family protein [Clostridium saccharoperbutylacetonicum]|uniref:N-acetylmuramoyl-L-alanine amidase family protein n=1 Tax=Clostridium saccharoperbutylacetonicum TaxID=36745 RepID=UPI000983D70F|nr:cadherin-like beta sandwich domain-containing protein [Clostridium saccharoperbutylacetonicum]AQR97854.1 autolysin [Clostridium saccharoperbutylacetonicum]NSB33746.1 glucan-binding YG repeat protein [Clostridium saccharoperbutylacetonicum]